MSTISTQIVAQEPKVEVILASLDGRRLVINDDAGQALVICYADGTIEYGADYDPDTVARRFWEALAKACPGLVTDPGLPAGDRGDLRERRRQFALNQLERAEHAERRPFESPVDVHGALNGHPSR